MAEGGLTRPQSTKAVAGGTTLNRYDTGQHIRREVLGDEYVDRATNEARGPWRALQDLVAEWCWGTLWSRSQLQRRDRSLVTLAILGALGRHDEFGAHVLGARRNGVTEDEIAEVVMHLAIYAGVPAAIPAAKRAQAVIESTAKG
jgi:4-carboxymuconolactone decarboxylase